MLDIKRKIRGIKHIHQQQGLLMFAVGLIKKPYYKQLQRKYTFDVWHTTPYEFRNYAIKIVRYVNQSNPSCVCEIGCGIGDIIRNIKAGEKWGVDISKEAILCAQHLDKKTKYVEGGFEYAIDNLPNKIDCLITVNFIHNISPDLLREYYHDLINKHEISEMIVDSVDAQGYMYCHDFASLIKEYEEAKTIFEHEGRKVLVLRKKNIK